MEFRDKQAIYLQIVEYVCEQILLGNWQTGNKILSIRELAVYMEVTPNTIQRTYDFLQQKQIITNRRGVGYFLEEEGMQRVLAYRRELFLENELPLMFRNMHLLKIGAEEVNRRFEEYINQNYKDK
ncbi:GntR family transcriptional regulator [Chitinophaga ginsengisoli]|uniref:GntR family transcriptional regulator n=1 Tax=Chitinophaga ginsengisoli TaxID=363837 RepID=A0A2P8FUC0_9BACT|nr:GntR family transcriptional regulator [Chitinophaga ginsengisoli]PSL25322.1 GntR family transcriptional regulator [Chitinophaga ginsengisoli]